MEEGIYLGVIGSKKNIRLYVGTDGVIELEGYWRENLVGRHEKGTLKGKKIWMHWSLKVPKKRILNCVFYIRKKEKRWSFVPFNRELTARFKVCTNRERFCF